MLRKLKQHFELIVFTAGFDIYAETIVREVEREEKFFDYVITRENCTPHPSGKSQVKDLVQLLDSRSIKDIIIVDNRATSFAIHFTNGVPIMDYEGDKSDVQLVYLTQYLLSFKHEKDIRNKIKQDFKLERFVQERNAIRNRMKSAHSFSGRKTCIGGSRMV